jgi:hypothetical protein
MFSVLFINRRRNDMTTETKKINKGVRIDKTTWHRISMVAIDRNENRSAMINRIIDEWLRKNESSK